MSYSCEVCRDTGKRVLHVADDGAVTHSDYLDCHHCEAASQIAARPAAPAPQAVVVPPELPPLPDPTIEGTKYHPEHKICYSALVHFTADQMRAYAEEAVAAALASSPVAQQQGIELEPGWKLIKVNDQFHALMESLDRAQSKGYMPDAISEEWEAFDWSAWPQSTASPSNPKEQGNG
jgi:hypothetical protein